MTVTFYHRPRILSEEAADRLGISLRTLYRYLESGLLREPKDYAIIGNQRLRFWSEQEIENARQLLIRRATDKFIP